jgi:RNA polymerase sigma-70 factor, ECF subfamily
MLDVDSTPAMLRPGLLADLEGHGTGRCPMYANSVAESHQEMESKRIAQLLQEWRAGDEGAYARLIPVVYDELRRLARAQLRGERAGHSLQPTLLVHEAYLRLGKADVDWRDRTHFLSVAARVMRRILVERARAKRATKRGGDEVRVTLSDPILSPHSNPIDILVLNDAMERLRELDTRQAEIVELCYFGGLTYAEIAEALGVSEATVDRDLRHARAWLRRELSAR